MADSILNSKILYQQRPLEGIEAGSLLNDIESFIRNNTKTDKDAQPKKEITVGGVRG